MRLPLYRESIDNNPAYLSEMPRALLRFFSTVFLQTALYTESDFSVSEKIIYCEVCTPFYIAVYILQNHCILLYRPKCPIPICQFPMRKATFIESAVCHLWFTQRLPLRQLGLWKPALTHKSKKMALLVLILLSLPVSSVSPARIAGFIAIGGSHYISMKNIFEELASRGHQVEQTILFFSTLF